MTSAEMREICEAFAPVIGHTEPEDWTEDNEDRVTIEAVESAVWSVEVWSGEFSHVEACAGPTLLEGWCGPVVTDCDGPAMMFGGVLHGLHMQHGSTMGGFFVQWREAEIALSLDLARAECRDRVARVLYGHVKGRAGRPSFITFEAHNAFWLDGMRWWPHQWDDGTTFYTSGGAPALATLDPSDPRRLPDGSRYVDALALRLVAEEVLRG